MAKAQWAALILLGSGEADLEGAQELCASIFHYEPEVVSIAIACDSDFVTDLARTAQFTQNPRIHLITAPPKHAVSARGKYLGANVLYALNFMLNRFNADFVLKLDADSLIIGPMSERVADFMASTAVSVV